MKSKLNQQKKWLFFPILLLSLFSCRKDDSPVIEKQIDVTGFTKIYAGERFNLTITKGANFYVKVKGPSNSVNDIDWNVANNILDIQYMHNSSNRPKVDVTITVPTLIQVNLTGAGTCIVDGFGGATHLVRTVLSGASKCTLNGTGVNTQIEISGASELNVNGTTGSLYGNISGAGKLNAYDLTSTEVDISASGGSEAKVKVEQLLYAEATGGSRIYYRGNPSVRNIHTSGGGQVIQQ